MIRKTTFLLIALFALPVLADDRIIGSPHSQTTYPTSARFQVVQSPLIYRQTFRLDTYTGRVYQLVKLDNGLSAWEELQVRDRPNVGAVGPRFAMFLSGVAVRGAFMFDIQTGQTWQAVLEKIDPSGADSDDNTTLVWNLMEVFDMPKKKKP